MASSLKKYCICIPYLHSIERSELLVTSVTQVHVTDVGLHNHSGGRGASSRQ